VALEEMDTQRNGLVFVYNMSNSKYSNFDYELSQKMLTLLKGETSVSQGLVFLIFPRQAVTRLA
jgi:hypothetical protein